MQTYQLTLGSLTRHSATIRLNATTSIASFVLLGDAEPTGYAARQLSQRLTTTKFDYLVTMESKGIPLAQAPALSLQTTLALSFYVRIVTITCSTRLSNR